MRPSPPLAMAAAALAAALISGCGAFRSLVGADTVDLKGADIQEMRLDLRKAQKTICPREPVQLALFVKAKLEGEAEARPFETWQGKEDADRNDKLDFNDFVFQSDLGKVDKDGFFQPTRDLLATVDKEFSIQAAFRLGPSRSKAAGSYRPDYDCITNAGGRGVPGQPGKAGRHGNAGVAAGNGGTGGDGNIGIPGERGADGGHGPELRAFATMVSTPFYPKLVAVRIEGPTPDFLLFPVGKVITLRAVGGPGGPGGPGGDGGPGGQGGEGAPAPGDGGRGGDGASGGHGGNGGNGGALELIVDERFPELAQSIRLDVSGGPAGAGGREGRGGRGGNGGIGSRAQTEDGQNNAPADGGAGRGERGADGTHGRPGANGKPGPAGRASSQPGKVAEAFQGLRGITPL
ncbi:MAG: hypothetical protein IT372_22075 [Polyangiaceae bacterium]|nr:hypothetical protein [Polyangiaceae bacterium]